MKRSVPVFILLLALCLPFVFCGCDAAAEQDTKALPPETSVSTAAPETVLSTEALPEQETKYDRALPETMAIPDESETVPDEVKTIPAEIATEPEEPSTEPAPESTADRLELDRVLIGRIYAKDGALYFKARDLEQAWATELTVRDDGGLQLQAQGRALILRDGSAEVETETEQVLLCAPVLLTGTDWYLPIDGLEKLWSRSFVYDRAESVLHFLRFGPGPMVSFNGAAAIASRMWGDAVVLPAERLAALSGGSAEVSDRQEGDPVLTFRLHDHVFHFWEGAVEAELDGAVLTLPSPVRREGGIWYLPVGATAGAAGFVAVWNAAGDRLTLFQPTEGKALWFNGTGLGTACDLGGIPAAKLSALAGALGGTLVEGADCVVLKVSNHTLCFRAGSPEMLVDGRKLPLPIPAIWTGREWLVPLRPLAEAFELPDRSNGSGLIFTRVEALDTAVWINGVRTGAYGMPDGPCCVRMSDVAAASGGSLRTDGNTAELEIWGRTVTVEGGSAITRIGTSKLRLASPVLADGADWYVPTDLLKAVGFSELQDSELEQIYYTHIVENTALVKGFRVPVFMYHAVSDNIWGITELFVSPSELEAQLRALTEGGYTPITFEDLDRIGEIEKPVMLTFDDGYDDNYTELFPLLKKYNVKATIFVIVNDIGKRHKLTEAQIREMSDSGLVSIQSHTMSHGYLDEMYSERLHWEHYNSMLKLTRITGKQPFVLCYPTGRSTGASRAITAQYYEYGLCMGGPCFVTGDSPYYICRYYVPRGLPLSTFLSYLH